eukprot:gene12584-6404_t
MNKFILVVALVLFQIILAAVPARQTSASSPNCSRQTPKCFLAIKSGSRKGKPSRNLLPRNVVCRIKNGLTIFKQICGAEALKNYGRTCTNKRDCVDYTKCSCLGLLKGLERRRHSLAPLLKKLISQQNSRTYVTYERYPKLFPFSHFYIGKTATLENENEISLEYYE